MSTVETTDQVQCTVDQRGNIMAVVVSPELWQRIVAALEDIDDRALVQALRTRLVSGPAASGVLRWQDVADEWQ